MDAMDLANSMDAVSVGLLVAVVLSITALIMGAFGDKFGVGLVFLGLCGLALGVRMYNNRQKWEDSVDIFAQGPPAGSGSSSETTASSASSMISQAGMGI